MSSLISLVILVALLLGCQASVSFENEQLPVDKLDIWGEKLEKLLNKTIELEEQRLQEASVQNRNILHTLDNINQRSGPKSCENVEKSGRYNMTVSNKIFEVYCDKHEYDGGWIVIQNRFNGLVDFYRHWTEYRNGFGDLEGEFWLGLKKIYWLTSSKNYELLVHLEDFNGVKKYARYNKFVIGSENEQFTLKTLGSYHGTAGDSLTYSKDAKFSTYDRKNDASSSSSNCAQYLKGAWWYQNCAQCNLNGKYQNVDSVTSMFWDGFKGYSGLKVSKMMIREV